MPAYVFCRHLVKNRETFKEYEDGLDRISQAYEISKSKGYGLKFGLIITIDTPLELRESVFENARKRPKIGIYHLDSRPRGAGTAFKEALINPSLVDIISTVVMLDLDQYVIDTKDGLSALTELVEKVEKDEALFGIGSRDCPVILAQDERNSNLRIIHELFHSCVIGPKKLKVGEKENVTPAYAEIGESTSGFYVANLSHPRYLELVQSVVRASQIANLSTFVADYYSMIKASLLGKIATGYVRTRKNKFYEIKDKKEEEESVKKFIAESAKELGKTDVGELVRNTVKDKKNIDLISLFYPREDVELVRELMLAEF